jgi:cytoskeletal protein CcmA (bactofilin family)
MIKSKDESQEVTEVKAFMGEGTDFKGILSFEGTARIDGRVEGEVESLDTLIVGEKARVNADVRVGTLIALGKIKGNIQATNRVALHASCELCGNVKTPAIVIEEGAVFDGKCEMIGDKAKKKEEEEKASEEKVEELEIEEAGNEAKDK